MHECSTGLQKYLAEEPDIFDDIYQFALQAVMFRVCRPSLVRVKQLMGSHFGGNKLMA